jgi:hypothetical protein
MNALQGIKTFAQQGSGLQSMLCCLESSSEIDQLVGKLVDLWVKSIDYPNRRTTPTGAS